MGANRSFRRIPASEKGEMAGEISGAGKSDLVGFYARRKKEIHLTVMLAEY